MSGCVTIILPVQETQYLFTALQYLNAMQHCRNIKHKLLPDIDG
jgi:hypothetical protein